ncbi:hypothetical protein Tco_0694376 [Tanacetum coccineum]
MVISSPCLTDIKNWLVQSKRLLLASPKQTALGKDISNPLIVDSLLKTIWLSMHHVIAMKHWLFQSKRLLIYSMAGSDDENPPPPTQPQKQAPHTVSTIKLPILKKGEYDIWAMKMEHYLSHTDYPIWEVIQKGNMVCSPLKVANQKFIRLYLLLGSQSTTYKWKTLQSYTDELMYSFFANQSSSPQLDHEDLEQLDEFDLEEMDLKWQVAMILMRLKNFYKKTDKRNQENRRRDAGNTGYKAKDNGRRPGKQEEPKALVTLDGEGVDWTGHAEDEQENFALMAYSNSGSDTKMCVRRNPGLGNGDQVHEVPTPMIRTIHCLQDMIENPISSIETLESMPEPVVVEPKVVSQPKVWSDAPIIEEYESDSDDEYVIEPSKEQEKPPSFRFVNLFSHLIRDYDFHEKRMAKQDNPQRALKEQRDC